MPSKKLCPYFPARQYKPKKLKGLACGEKVGSVAGARRHHRAKELLCARCAVVWAEYQHKMYIQRKARNNNAI